MEIKRLEKIFFFIILILILVILVLPSVTSINFLDWIKELGQITGMSSSDTTSVSLTIQNFAPNVTNVTITDGTVDWSITGGNYTNLTFSFMAMDKNGVSNLDDTSMSASINITLGLESGARNTTDGDSACTYIGDVGGNANYSCEILIWYWDLNGTWTINATICDSNNACASNLSRNFSLGSTADMTMSPTALNFGTISSGTSNNTATDDPITINNTGNKNISIGNIQVTTIDLVGTDTKTISASNFTVGIDTGSNKECNYGSLANMTFNNTAIGVTRAGVERGNNSIGATTATEKLYFCYYPVVPTYLTAQAYTTTPGEWTIGVV